MRALLSSRSRPSQLTRRLSALLATMGMLAACPDLALAGAEPLPIGRMSQPTSTLQDMVAEASRRFGVPASWIAEVMAVESRGHANALSPKGAIGLLQVMPETYAAMRDRYGLGANPWDPRDNVLAGTAYLRLLYDRYGAPGFLVAYNAGPGRWDDYRLRGRLLPPETVAYLARLGPAVGGSVLPMPSLTATEAARSPLASPLFVRLASIAIPMQSAAGRERIVQIIDANASVVGRAETFFVTHPSAADASSVGQPNDGRAADAAPSSATPPPTSLPSDPSRNPLFPERISPGSQQ